MAIKSPLHTGEWQKRLSKSVDPSTHEEDKRVREYLEKLQGDADALTIPDLGEWNPEEYGWSGDFDPTLYQGPAHINAESVSAGPDVQYRNVDTALAQLERAAAAPDVVAERAKAAPNIAARRVDANTAAFAEAGPSAFDDVAIDPRLKEAQFAALSQLQEIGDSGGMTAADRAALSRIQGDVAAADRGRRDAIMQNMSARGMAGGGMELLAQLQSNQAATDRAAQQGLDVAALAEQRALDAIMQSGGLASSIRGQDFGEQSAVAQARDAISRFNAANLNQSNQFNAGQLSDTARFNAAQDLTTQQFNAGQANDMSRFNVGQANSMGQFNASRADDTSRFNAGQANDMSRFNTGSANDMSRFNATNALNTDMYNRDANFKADTVNVGARNDMARFNQSNNINIGMANADTANRAGMYNHEGRQNTASANVDARNKAGFYNSVERPQAQFDMAAKKLGAKTAANQAGMDFWTKAGDRKAARAGQTMQGGAVAGGALITALSDEQSKDSVASLSEDDIAEFLDAVQPKTFKYKKKYAGGDNGTKAGFLMQDVADTKVGKLIERDGPDGMKAFDTQALQGVMLAALKSLAEGKKK